MYNACVVTIILNAAQIGFHECFLSVNTLGSIRVNPPHQLELLNMLNKRGGYWGVATSVP